MLTHLQVMVKSSNVDTNNHLSGILLAFNSLNQEFSPGSHLINNFHNYFSFYLASHKNTDTKTTHQNKLKNLYEESSNNQDTILIISDICVKNNVAISVLDIWRGHEIIMKTVYHTMNISLT